METLIGWILPWGVLSNIGNKTGMYGKLDRFANEFHRALNTTPGNTLIGTGINPEGIENSISV